MVWGGLRVRVGMAYGYISAKKPLNTGVCGVWGLEWGACMAPCGGAHGVIMVCMERHGAHGAHGASWCAWGIMVCMGLHGVRGAW